ncbi:MAG: LuxR C-terminal-related transcriptional regulator [Pirellula sp.]|jgi:FixJ family two-component response regulator|nr:LuxR C-terminal-related transcriptional regulator [Pirellula sp.]
MNLRNLPSKPVVYLMSGTPQIAELVQRLGEILGFDTVLMNVAVELSDRISGAQPSCIVLPLEGGCQNAETVLRKLPDLGLALPAIVITGDLPVDIVVKIMEHGAFKVLYKTFSPEILRTFLEQALQLDAKRLDMKQHFLETQHALCSLTDRQLLVLKEILEGKPTKSIAIELGASTRVIEKERSEILLAFHVKSTAEVTFRIGEYRVLRRMKNRFDPPHLETPSPHYDVNTSQTAYSRFLERFGEL